jgi:DNA-directed RNA polymerase subunit H (RpoH/RPB5)
MLHKRQIDDSDYEIMPKIPEELNGRVGVDVWVDGQLWAWNKGTQRHIPDFIMITEQPRIGIVQLRLLKALLTGKQTALVVTRYPLTTQAMKTTCSGQPTSVIQCILWVNVIFDPQAHHLGCQHRRIEAAELQKRMRTTVVHGHLPKLLRTDPVAVYMRFVVGDIIEVDRGDERYYRVVI